MKEILGALGNQVYFRKGTFDADSKYDAWKELAGLSQDEAKEKYIAFVEELKAADKK